MGHNCCSKQKVKKGLWSPDEDQKLFNFITSQGHSSWSSVPKLAGLQRCGKSCRLRWINYLRPDLKRGEFSAQEERRIIEVHRMLGNKWAQIAKYLPGRTDNEIKNFWNSYVKKKLISQGLDPNTHNLLPPTPNSSASSSSSSSSSTLVFSVDREQTTPSSMVKGPLLLPFHLGDIPTTATTTTSINLYNNNNNDNGNISNFHGPPAAEIFGEMGMWGYGGAHGFESKDNVVLIEPAPAAVEEEEEYKLLEGSLSFEGSNSILLDFDFGTDSFFSASTAANYSGNYAIWDDVS